VLLYYITDRTQFDGTEARCRAKLLERIAEAARAGVDFIQVREKDLTTHELERLAGDAVAIVRASCGSTRLLINSRTDVALAVKADGVHLRSADITSENIREIWHKSGSDQEPVVAISCHTEGEVVRAAESGADFAVFGPVFEKRNAYGEPTGIDQLRSVCRHTIPVLALGGVTKANAATCVEAGAVGVAGIRLFQEGDLRETMKVFRDVKPAPPSMN
jgi:thiamine-phosphate pyrophosphorylase